MADKPATYVQAGALLDRPGKAPKGNSTIVVRDGKVAQVLPGFVAPPAGARLVDLRDRFVLPGLVDMHVHLWGVGGDPMRERLNALTTDDADDMMQAVVNAKTTLDAGFTTVRDLGGNPRGIRRVHLGKIVRTDSPMRQQDGFRHPAFGSRLVKCLHDDWRS